jgi:NAD-dependent SIR2 family protein deacetylase
MLLDLVKEKEDHFVVTSNIDGAHHKVGFDNVYEIHGRLHKFQCIECDDVWSAPEDTFFDVDVKSYTLKNEVPKCVCGGITRPNVMMFGYDTGFNKTETNQQSKAFNEFMVKYDKGDHKIAIIEIGAGESVPTIRTMSEFIHERVPGATLIRINPTDTFVPDVDAISIKMTALEAIESLINF